MTKELAKTLTTALVQFIDREQPKDKMCVSSVEAEELERCFTEEKFNRVEDWCAYRMKPELTEFEKCMLDFAKARDEYEFDSTKVVELNDKVIELTKSYAKTLLALAKKELMSYADESNPAIEAMADLEKEIERVVENYNSLANGSKVMKPSGIEKIARHFYELGLKARKEE